MFIRKASIRERYSEHIEKTDFSNIKDISEKIPNKPTIPGLIERLNNCNSEDVLDLWTIVIDYLPSAFKEGIDELPFELYIENSDDDILTVILYLLLKSEYGKSLNRNMSRIIKKRFKLAKISKEHIKLISDKIEPIFSQNPTIDEQDKMLIT